MNKTKYKHGDMPVRVFKPGGMAQFGLFIAIIFVALHFTIMTTVFRQAETEVIWFHLLFIPVYGFIFFTLFMSMSTSIAIYEDGLEYRYGSSRTLVRWEDISHFEYRKRGKSSVKGIVTRVEVHPQVAGSIIEKLLHHRWDKTFIDLSTVVKIPTESTGWFSPPVVDTAALRRTDFGRIMSQYAPHLFDDYAKRK